MNHLHTSQRQNTNGEYSRGALPVSHYTDISPLLPSVFINNQNSLIRGGKAERHIKAVLPLAYIAYIAYIVGADPL